MVQTFWRRTYSCLHIQNCELQTSTESRQHLFYLRVDLYDKLNVWHSLPLLIVTFAVILYFSLCTRIAHHIFIDAFSDKISLHILLYTVNKRVHAINRCFWRCASAIFTNNRTYHVYLTARESSAEIIFTCWNTRNIKLRELFPCLFAAFI